MTLSACDLAPAHVRAIAPYQPGKPIDELARELGLEASGIVKLASNENPLGPGPRAVAAVEAALEELARYPDGNGYALKSALSGQLGCPREGIVLGNGSNDVLDLVARAFLTPGTSAVYAQHAFAVYPLATLAQGAAGIEVPAREFGHDLEAMLAAIRADTRVVWIANPNNPTGTLLAPDALAAFLARVPQQVVVVLDEAYNEYLAPELRADSVAWVKQHPNLVVTRTFSKAYGLAGLRVGYALAQPALADLLNRVRQPFNVNSLALVAATAALDDSDHLARGVALNRAGMLQLVQGVERIGCRVIPSHGNFVCVEVGDAATLYPRLLRQGVIVRPVANYGLPGHLRVSVGLLRENERFLHALERVLQE